MKNSRPSRWLPVSLMLLVAPLAQAALPIIQTKFTADPAPFVHDGVVYLYTTHDEDDAPAGMARFLMREWLLYTSTDMVNWTDRGVMADLDSFEWKGWGGAGNGAWAHQVIERNGKFYLYVTVHGAGIGVLVADSPMGPFKDPIGKPLVGGEFDTIDPTVMIDDDGQAYLYWGNPNLWFVKLNEDMISLGGEITKDERIRKVEGQSDPFHYQEGPWVWKRNGRYYNAYASTCCPEGIGYAISNGPTGPWEFKGHIMRPDNRSSGNHPGIIDYKGRSYVFGFNYALNFMRTDQHHERRSVCVTEFQYNEDGTIPELPWWEEAETVAQIGTLDPYVRNEGETIAWSEGMKSAPLPTGGMCVYPQKDGAFIKVQGVDFGADGAGAFTASVACETGGGVIELRIGSADGRLIGTLPVSDTGGQWQNGTIEVTGAAGVQDLFFVFVRSGIEPFCRFDHWQFHR